VSTVCRLRTGRSWVRIPAWSRDFSLPQNLQPGTGPHTASHSTCTVVLFPEVKQPTRGTGHSPPYSAEVKNEGSYTSTPLYNFIA
jgi:hypothetical protein